MRLLSFPVVSLEDLPPQPVAGNPNLLGTIPRRDGDFAKNTNVVPNRVYVANTTVVGPTTWTPLGP